jgi:hypothetical protein
MWHVVAMGTNIIGAVVAGCSVASIRKADKWKLCSERKELKTEASNREIRSSVSLDRRCYSTKGRESHCQDRSYTQHLGTIGVISSGSEELLVWRARDWQIKWKSTENFMLFSVVAICLLAPDNATQNAMRRTFLWARETMADIAGNFAGNGNGCGSIKLDLP